LKFGTFSPPEYNRNFSEITKDNNWKATLKRVRTHYNENSKIKRERMKKREGEKEERT